LTYAQKASIMVKEGALLGLYAASAASVYLATTAVARVTVEGAAKALELGAEGAKTLAGKARKAISKDPEAKDANAEAKPAG
jgi:hypothetical protein